MKQTKNVGRIEQVRDIHISEYPTYAESIIKAL